MVEEEDQIQSITKLSVSFPFLFTLVSPSLDEIQPDLGSTDWNGEDRENSRRSTLILAQVVKTNCFFFFLNYFYLNCF